jgi:hypothetical protein
MLQGSRGLEPEFADPHELLYRRCDPAHIEAGHVLPIAVDQFNLSVLRSRFCSNPDHARWDSRVGAKDGQAFVYPDWLVIQFSVLDASLTRTPENPAAQVHTLRPVHAPLLDNYAHSELGLFKGDPPRRLAKEGDAKGESKLAKKQFRTILADKATIRLQSNEGCSFVPKYDWRVVTKLAALHISPSSDSRRVGRLPSRTVVQVQAKNGRWVMVKAPNGLEGWLYRRRLRRVVRD